MKVELTVKQYAAIEQVTTRTVRRWIVKGAVTVRRTPGGGLRIPTSTLPPLLLLMVTDGENSGQSMTD